MAATSTGRLVDAGEQILSLVASGRFVAEERYSETFEHLPRQLDALKHRAFTGKSIVTLERTQHIHF
ncbi:hypothetical protein QCE47_17025 [Caballeronia sp. LZ025]|uniref:hypothetical protein n=1 Tax=Caballeronia TaxID=1827195 RepID=UPI001FD52C97|nr:MULTISPECIES: hypothetical protein [Caballeronia]MDR5734014.1 hypothetical protein [Caballeronia sp. LZ025]